MDTDPFPNVVDEWVAILGLNHQSELAAAVNRDKTRAWHWRRANQLPADVVLDLNQLAIARGLTVPDRLLQRPLRAGLTAGRNKKPSTR